MLYRTMMRAYFKLFRHTNKENYAYKSMLQQYAFLLNVKNPFNKNILLILFYIFSKAWSTGEHAQSRAKKHFTC